MSTVLGIVLIVLGVAFGGLALLGLALPNPMGGSTLTARQLGVWGLFAFVLFVGGIVILVR